MKYWNLLTIIFLLISGHVKAQQFENDSILIWNQKRALSWNDFKSITIPKKSRKAGIELSLNFSPNPLGNDNIENIKIIAVVFKYNSWVKEKEELLLNHEQTHFNIAELYTRKIRRDLQKYFDNNIQYELDSIAEIYNCLEDEFWKTQNKYDNETNHSKNKNQQKKWDRKIDSLLQVYKNYERQYTIEDFEIKKN